MKSLVLEIGAGELLDWLTILEIKARHAKDQAQSQRSRESSGARGS